MGAEEPLAEWERELLAGDADKAAVAATGGDAATETPAAEGTGAAAEATEVAADATEVAAEATEAPLEEAVATDAVVAEAPAVETEAAPEVEVEAVTEAAPEAEFGADSAAPLEDGSAPEGFEIKGNKNSMKFHAPSSPWYARTNAEVWFRTAEAAEAAGFANAETSTDAAEGTDSETVEA